MSLPSTRNASSSYYQFQQSLDQYVYFSPLTMGGASGRAVKIHKDLFLPFFCIVDPATHDGQSIIRQIENLRTTCTIVRKETGSGYANNPRQGEKHKTQLTKVNSAFHQVLIIKNLHVHYRVSQEDGDKAPGIYISHIRQVNRDSGGTPGLYEQQSSMRGAGGARKVESQQVDGKKVYINGSAKTLNKAMFDARITTKDENSLLFYCPARATDEMGLLGKSIRSRITTDTVNELANILKKNQKSTRGVTWYVEGEGVNVLNEAVKQVSGELSTHQFNLINPVANTARLIEALANKKAKCNGEFFQYESNRKALISLGTQREEIMQAIGKLPAGKNYDIITRNYIVKFISELPSIGTRAATQSKSTSITKTFVQLLKAAGTYRK